MPIYAYKCETCGHAADVLQKISEPVLTQCPACGASTYVKQVTAAGFQLKGSGWYVTDFRDGGGKKQDKPAAPAADGDAAPAKPAEAASPATAPSAPAAAPAPSAAASSSPSV
jgi:putative FmdB family regulatory protein